MKQAIEADARDEEGGWGQQHGQSRSEALLQEGGQAQVTGGEEEAGDSSLC